MKKKVTLVIFLGAFAICARAQDFYHGGGGGILSIMYHQVYTIPGVMDADFQGSTLNYGFTYNPFLNFEIDRSKSLNVASYPFLGFSFNSREGGTLGIEIPVVAELFIGDIEDQGGFVGVGINWAKAADDDFNGSLFGPQISGGGQFYFKDNLIKARLAYTIGVSSSKELDIEYTKNTANALSILLIYPFGL